MARTRLTLDVEGLEGAVQAIRTAGSEAQAAASAAVGEETEAVADDMRTSAPFLTGALEESIQAEHDGLAGRAVATDEAAEHQEHGTSRHPAQPFAGPAALASESRFPDRVTDAVRGAVE
jgi:hypothetical protein